MIWWQVFYCFGTVIEINTWLYCFIHSVDVVNDNIRVYYVETSKYVSPAMNFPLASTLAITNCFSTTPLEWTIDFPNLTQCKWQHHLPSCSGKKHWSHFWPLVFSNISYLIPNSFINLMDSTSSLSGIATVPTFLSLAQTTNTSHLGDFSTFQLVSMLSCWLLSFYL